jgi:hypothetical protein
MKTISRRLSKLEERLGIAKRTLQLLSRLTPRNVGLHGRYNQLMLCRAVQVLQLYQCRRVSLRSFGLTTLRFLRHVTNTHFSGQSVPKYAPKLTKLKGLPNIVRYSQPSEGGIDSLLAIGAGEDDF